MRVILSGSQFAVLLCFNKQDHFLLPGQSVRVTPSSLRFSSTWRHLPLLSVDWSLLAHGTGSDGFLTLSPISSSGDFQNPSSAFQAGRFDFAVPVPMSLSSSAPSPSLLPWPTPTLPAGAGLLSFPCHDGDAPPSLPKNSLCLHSLRPPPESGNSFCHGRDAREHPDVGFAPETRGRTVGLCAQGSQDRPSHSLCGLTGPGFT